MTGLPDTRVFLDNGTGTFPLDITSKARLVEGYGFNRGRDDWQAAVTSGSLSVTLDNSDGRFSPGSTILGTPSPIKVDQRIRIRETVNGTTYNRFTGYVKSWPVSWPAVVDTFATVGITASDAQARAERRILRTVIAEEVLELGAAFYFALDGPAESTSASDLSGNQYSALNAQGGGTVAPAFGTDAWQAPVGAGSTGVQFTATTGQYLGSSETLWPFGGGTGAATFVCLFRSSSAPVSLVNRMLGIETGSGKLRTELGGGIHSAGAVNDGLDHTGIVTDDGTTTTLYLDGVSVGTGVSAANFQSLFEVGGGANNSPDVISSSIIGHVAGFEAALSAAEVARVHAAIMGATVESGTARITRLAGYAGIPLGTLDPSLTDVATSDLDGRSVWDAIQEATDAEFGVAFVDGSGNLIFHNRERVSIKTTPDVTIDADHVSPDAQPTLDDQQILNYLEVTAAATGVAQVINNAASETAHGRYSDSKSYMVTTDAEALDRANWIITNFAEPTRRFGSLTINLFGMTALEQQAAVSKLEPDCWLRVTNLPDQTPGGGTSVDLVVEGIRAEQSMDAWTITCNVVVRDLFNVAILDDPVYGVFDSPKARFGI